MFDRASAKKAGYSDAEIDKFLDRVKAAKQAGYTDDEIRSFLSPSDKMSDSPKPAQSGYSQDAADFIGAATPANAYTENFGEKHTVGRSISQVLGGAAGVALAPHGGPYSMGLGGAIGGQIYDLVAQSALKTQKPESLGERFESAAYDFGLDVISTPALAQGVYATKKLANYSLESFKRLMPKPKTALSKFREFGTTPTVAEMTGSRAATIAENALSDWPFTSARFQKHAAKSLDELKFSNRLLAEEYGDVLTTEEVGTLIREGSEKAIGKLKGIYDKLYKFVGKEFAGNPLPIDNTAAFLNEMTSKIGKEPVNKNVIKIADEIIKAGEMQSWSGGLPWETLKNWRSEVGELLKNPLLLSQRDLNTGQLKQLYKVITADMEAAALAAGPQTHARWRAADKYFQVSMTRDVPLLERIVSKGYDEEIRAAVMMSRKDGGSRLRTLRRRLSPEEFDAVVATELGSMGVATPNAQNAAGDVFSVNTFMTKWNNISQSAKDIMFKGTRHQELGRQLDRFAEVSSALKEVDRLANKSRTGSVLGFLSIFSSLGAATGGAFSDDTATGMMKGAVAGASLVMLPKVAARALTSPRFVEWLSDGIKIAKANPQNMSTHMSRLMVLRFEPEIQDAVNEIVLNHLRIKKEEGE